MFAVNQSCAVPRTPTDVSCGTEMDYLVMGNYMLDKRDQPKFTDTADWKTEFKLD